MLIVVVGDCMTLFPIDSGGSFTSQSSVLVGNSLWLGLYPL